MKIIPVFKLCTACGGIGEVEHIPHKEPGKGDIPNERVEKCYVCGGEGYFPTGTFIIENREKGTFREALNKLPDNIRKTLFY